jgi:hypothetical protein
MTTRNALVVIGSVVVATLGWGIDGRAGSEPTTRAPDVRVYRFGGIPKKIGYTLLKRITVPRGKCFHITHTMALAERHSGGLPDAGEFTVMVGDLAQSSLESGNGIAYQGQGMRDVTLRAGQSVDLGYWLRRGKNPTLYYYGVSLYATIYDCHN